MRLNAEWKPDFGGREDYDGPVLSISSRYWPNGSASATLLINFQHPDGSMDDLPLARGEFTGANLAEVAPQVEAWAQEQMDRAVRVLAREFSVSVNDEAAP